MSEAADDTQTEEERNVGHVRLAVYMAYGQAVGTFLVSVLLVSLTLMQVSFTLLLVSYVFIRNKCGHSCITVIDSCPQATRNGADLWLSHWVVHEGMRGVFGSSYAPLSTAMPRQVRPIYLVASTFPCSSPDWYPPRFYSGY